MNTIDNSTGRTLFDLICQKLLETVRSVIRENVTNSFETIHVSCLSKSLSLDLNFGRVSQIFLDFQLIVICFLLSYSGVVLDSVSCDF